ncbi:unnamed protein product, partial [Nesidiocoris tenuis]
MNKSRNYRLAVNSEVVYGTRVEGYRQLGESCGLITETGFAVKNALFSQLGGVRYLRTEKPERWKCFEKLPSPPNEKINAPAEEIKRRCKKRGKNIGKISTDDGNSGDGEKGSPNVVECLTIFRKFSSLY